VPRLGTGPVYGLSRTNDVSWRDRVRERVGLVPTDWLPACWQVPTCRQCWHRTA